MSILNSGISEEKVALTKISIVAPCRNEIHYIDSFIESLLRQDFSMVDPEILIADGLSDDGTTQRLAEWAESIHCLKIIKNAGLTVSKGLNLALREATGYAVIRMDIHTSYATNYIHECVRVLHETGASCVGGAWVAKGNGFVQSVIAASFQSPFGSGGASSRNANYSGPVDTVYLGAWRREELLSIGGFDEALVRNQDDELSLRILRSGGSVWQSSTICSKYHPRASFTALFCQFQQYGYWKIPVIRKHKLPASIRHIVPFAFISIVLILIFCSVFSVYALKFLCLLIGLYVAMILISALATITVAKLSFLSVCPIALALACMHFGYGIGFARGMFDFFLLQRGADQAMSRLSR